MQSIEHYNRNYAFVKPATMTDKECNRLHVQSGVLPIGPDGNQFNVIVSGWKLSAEELARINETGVVWLSITGQGMPPVCLMVDNPLPDTGQHYETGKESWIHGFLVNADEPNGARCLGPCPKCGDITVSSDVFPDVAWHCTSVYCENFNNLPTAEGHDLYPWWWNKGFIIRKDGNKWMAGAPDFINIQVSPVGFSDNPDDAVNQLLLAINAQKQ